MQTQGDSELPEQPEAEAKLPEDLKQIISHLPNQDEQELVKRLIINRTSIHGAANPIADKLTAQHITAIISNAHEQESNGRKERNTHRLFMLTIVLVALGFILALVMLLRAENKDLLITIIAAMLSFLGGLGLGRGFLSGK